MKSWPALEIPAPDDLVQAALTDFDVAAIDDNAPDAWRVFFHRPEERDRAAAALREQFPDLIAEAVDVPDENWAARSQAALKAIRVGRIVVAPPWDAGSPEGLPHTPDAAQQLSAAITIVIQPSMGFGTGHHATTRLCLAHLQELDLRGRSVIDVGTGSGVLALAANRLGAAPVLAIDDDPDAIQSARENVDLNPGAEVTLGVVDLRRAALRPFDVVLANLTGGLLVSAAPVLQQLARPGGRLVVSGFMEHEEREVLAAFAACAADRRSQEDGWVAATLRRGR
jgi:ribosomal protein L11 methyltransferase